ncbi:MAG: hypothetical protein Q8P24_19040 [Desulfobacterales bacterium]|nr:hypothetical protein [Desulfobacterales bacterium]
MCRRSDSCRGHQLIQYSKDIIEKANLAARSAVVGKYGHYIKYAGGIVRDTKTGLEWYAGPDEDTSLGEAKSWADNLDIDGGGWRMPTQDELQVLEKDAGSMGMIPLLETVGEFIWAGETFIPPGNKRPAGMKRGLHDFDISYGFRGFAVRSRR